MNKCTSKVKIKVKKIIRAFCQKVVVTNKTEKCFNPIGCAINGIFMTDL